MRKIIAILGTLFIAAVIIISGSAVAAWVWVTVHSSNNCTNIWRIEGAPDGGVPATIGKNPDILGWVLLDLGSGNKMPPDQDFRVVAWSLVEEKYDVWVGENTSFEWLKYVGQGKDTRNETFTTPSSPDSGLYQYIYIVGATGVENGDHAYGPDIDAVGWNKP